MTQEEQAELQTRIDALPAGNIIRMRASENALKAAMRLDKQEADIKEAMKAQREALGLD